MTELRTRRLNTEDDNQNENNRRALILRESAMSYDEMMDQLKDELNSQNEYPFTEWTYRNIVLIGRTRAGKSTISSMIRDPFYMPPLASLFADTRNIAFNRITTNHDGNAYLLTIIDSPGLYDSMRNEGKRLTNDTIENYLDQCITRDITHIHAFAFVFSSSGGINIEDIHSMVFIKNKYPELRKFFVLIITHCEEKNEDERQHFIEEFFQHPDVVKYRLRDLFGLGVYFTGCLRPQLQCIPNIIAARNQARNIMQMRKELIDFIINCQDTYNIHYALSSITIVGKIIQGFILFFPFLKKRIIQP